MKTQIELKHTDVFGPRIFFLDAIASQEESHVRRSVTTFEIMPKDNEIS